MKVKTSELSGITLDYAVAICEGYNPVIREDNGYGLPVLVANFPGSYSIDWAYGGPIIERERITLRTATIKGMAWKAFKDSGGSHCAVNCVEIGTIPLIAAMRCYVTSKLGNVVDIPDSLIRSVLTA